MFPVLVEIVNFLSNAVAKLPFLPVELCTPTGLYTKSEELAKHIYSIGRDGEPNMYERVRKYFVNDPILAGYVTSLLRVQLLVIFVASCMRQSLLGHVNPNFLLLPLFDLEYGVLLPLVRENSRMITLLIQRWHRDDPSFKELEFMCKAPLEVQQRIVKMVCELCIPTWNICEGSSENESVILSQAIIFKENWFDDVTPGFTLSSQPDFWTQLTSNLREFHLEFPATPGIRIGPPLPQLGEAVCVFFPLHPEWRRLCKNIPQRLFDRVCAVLDPSLQCMMYATAEDGTEEVYKMPINTGIVYRGREPALFPHGDREILGRIRVAIKDPNSPYRVKYVGH